MLSRVLRGAEAASARPASFPQLIPVSGSRDLDAHDGRGSGNAGLADSGFAGEHPGAENSERKKATEAALDLARKEAFEAGRRQAEQDAKSQTESLIGRLTAAIVDLASLRHDLRCRAERDCVQLALLIARRVLHRQIAVDDNALNGIARVAFERIAATESCTVTVHPRFAEAVASALPASQRGRIRVEPDTACPPGSIVFRASDGLMDGSVDSQLEEIGAGLADRLGHQLPPIP